MACGGAYEPRGVLTRLKLPHPTGEPPVQTFVAAIKVNSHKVDAPADKASTEAEAEHP
jgi:hypothetical protein